MNADIFPLKEPAMFPAGKPDIQRFSSKNEDLLLPLYHIFVLHDALSGMPVHGIYYIHMNSETDMYPALYHFSISACTIPMSIRS